MRMTIRSTRDGWTKVGKQHYAHESVKADVIHRSQVEPGEVGWTVMTPRKRWYYYDTMAAAMQVAAKTATYFVIDSRPDCDSVAD